MHKINVKAILSPKNELNIYRGCPYDCIYCDIRQRLYNKIDFDPSDIEVKENAISILNDQLALRHERAMIQIGTLGDPYNEYEEELMLTRKSLEAIYDHGFGASIYTKSDLILRDIDILKKINERSKCVVIMSLTTTDDKLSKIIEPKATVASKRIEVLKKLNECGIPTIIYMSPLIPYINDTEDNVKAILEVAKECNSKGILYYGPGIILKEGNKKRLYSMMDKHFPILRRKYEREFKGRNLAIKGFNIANFDFIIRNFCENNDIIYSDDDVMYYITSFDQKNIQLSLFED